MLGCRVASSSWRSVSPLLIELNGTFLGLSGDYPILVRVQKETGKRAVFVVVSAVRLAAVQFDINLVPGVQMQDDTVASVVVILVGVLRNGAGSDLQIKREL